MQTKARDATWLLLALVGRDLPLRTRTVRDEIGWETDPSLAEQSRVMRDFAEIWQAADKIVYSRTLEAVPRARTRIERAFHPQAVRHLKAAAYRDLTVGGPQLAAHAFKAELVDECHLFLAPVLVGEGKRSLPEDVRLRLELMDQRRFGNGMVYLRYRTVRWQ